MKSVVTISMAPDKRDRCHRWQMAPVTLTPCIDGTAQMGPVRSMVPDKRDWCH